MKTATALFQCSRKAFRAMGVELKGAFIDLRHIVGDDGRWKGDPQPVLQALAI